MSISSTARKAGPYNGNGIAVAFPFAFKVFSDEDVLVVKTTPAAVESTLVLTTDYTVSLNADQDSNPGGTVTAVSAPASGYKITISSQVAELQPVVLTNAGGFYPKVINDALDRLTILTQQLAEKVARSVKVGISSSLTSDEFLADLSTAAVEAEASAAAAAASALAAEDFAATIDTANFAHKANNLSDLASASAARSNLGLVIGANVLAPDGDGSGLTGISTKQIEPIGASVTSNALTLTLNPTSLDFRSNSLTSGTVNTRTVASPVSVVVSSGSTLGTISAQSARLVVLAIDNAGTVELAVANLAGGVNLNETALITTTAEGGAGSADSATAIYSTAARTNVPFRVVGFVDITEATAGTWATAPSLIQGAGGISMAGLSGAGYALPVDLAGSRSLATTYYNTKGRPMAVRYSCLIAAGNQTLTLTVAGVAVQTDTQVNVSDRYEVSWPSIPPGAAYSITSTSATSSAKWIEQ